MEKGWGGVGLTKEDWVGIGLMKEDIEGERQAKKPIMKCSIQAQEGLLAVTLFWLKLTKSHSKLNQHHKV